MKTELRMTCECGVEIFYERVAQPGRMTVTEVAACPACGPRLKAAVARLVSAVKKYTILRRADRTTVLRLTKRPVLYY